MDTMEYKGFKAQIMKARRLEGSGVHGLPPGQAIDIYPVDAFESPLPHWIKGAGNYVVPVDSEWGLWFNWRMNDEQNTAVLLSIKGMNPITGQRSNGFVLERYENKCPVHDIDFKEGRFCEKCNYRWTSQNYVTEPNPLWWDGFRTEDGKVRQFFFTEELSKSIPELVIGKEDTVPAFGFAFFKPKPDKIRQQEIKTTRYGGGIISSGISGYSGCGEIKTSGGSFIGGQSVQCYSSTCDDGSIGIGTPSPESALYLSNNASPVAASFTCNSTPSSLKKLSSVRSKSVSKSVLYSKSLICEDSVNMASLMNVDMERSVSIKKKTSEVGVGAGAEISQDLKTDTRALSDWEHEPASVMRLYFIFIDQFKEISQKGMKDLVGEPEGYLSGLPVG